MPNEARRWLWILLLTAASVFVTLGMACATPFAALATLAALHMSRRDGLTLIGIAWLADQAVGYGLLGDPRTANSVAWGVVLGVGAFAALLAAQALADRVRARGAVLAGAARVRGRVRGVPGGARGRDRGAGERCRGVLAADRGLGASREPALAGGTAPRPARGLDRARHAGASRSAGDRHGRLIR